MPLSLLRLVLGINTTKMTVGIDVGATAAVVGTMRAAPEAAMTSPEAEAPVAAGEATKVMVATPPKNDD